MLPAGGARAEHSLASYSAPAPSALSPEAGEQHSGMMTPQSLWDRRTACRISFPCQFQSPRRCCGPAPPGLLRAQLSSMTRTSHGSSPLNSSGARSKLPGGDNCAPREMAGRRWGLVSFAQRRKKKKRKPAIHSHTGHDLMRGRECSADHTHVTQHTGEPPPCSPAQRARRAPPHRKRPMCQAFPLAHEHRSCTTPGWCLDRPLRSLQKEGGREVLISSTQQQRCPCPAGSICTNGVRITGSIPIWAISFALFSASD